jgi:hypothetical protein
MIYDTDQVKRMAQLAIASLARSCDKKNCSVLTGRYLAGLYDLAWGFQNKLAPARAQSAAPGQRYRLLLERSAATAITR